jgi:hypothetical protein
MLGNPKDNVTILSNASPDHCNLQALTPLIRENRFPEQEDKAQQLTHMHQRAFMVKYSSHGMLSDGTLFN